MASSELQEIGRWPARSKKVWRHPNPQLTLARLQTTKRASPLNGKRRPSSRKSNHSQRKPVDIVATQSTQGLIAPLRRKSATSVARLATLAVFVGVNLLAVVEAVIEVVPNQEGVVMNSQTKLVYALDGYQRNVEALIEVIPNQEGVVMNNQTKLVYALYGYQCNVEDAHGRGQRTCLRSDAAELLPDM